MKGNNDFVEVASTVNCVAILSEICLDMPALVVAIYLHPDDSARNQETKDTAMQIINAFTETHSNQQLFMLIAGDFNMTKEEMHKEDRNGDSFCETVMELFPSSPKATSFRSKASPRTIDWMFTSLKQKHV